MVPIGDTFARTGDVQFDFPPDVVFRALTEALPGLKGFKPLDTNAMARHVNVATAVSAWSWGERVTVSVTEVAPGKSAMSIASATKTMVGSASSHSKNRKNVELLIRATSDVLERSGAQWAAEMGFASTGASTTSPPAPAAPAAPAAPISSPSRLEQLKMLGELRDSGVLTDEEFEAEKVRIIADTSSPSTNTSAGMPPGAPAQSEPESPLQPVAQIPGEQKECGVDSPTGSATKASDLPSPLNSIGWHPVGDNAGLQAYWDGQQWSAYTRWDGAAWVAVPPGEVNAHGSSRDKDPTPVPGDLKPSVGSGGPRPTQPHGVSERELRKAQKELDKAIDQLAGFERNLQNANSQATKESLAAGVQISQKRVLAAQHRLDELLPKR